MVRLRSISVDPTHPFEPAGAVAVSKSQPVSESDSATSPRSTPADPWKNPSYPQRTHLHERAHWQGVLADWDARIAAARQAPMTVAMRMDFAPFERMLHQMQGARDQVADAVRRLPMETYDLYEEDRHGLDEAVSALNRLFEHWDALSSTGTRP
jgi:hypothetical protein